MFVVFVDCLHWFVLTLKCVVSACHCIDLVFSVRLEHLKACLNGLFIVVVMILGFQLFVLALLICGLRGCLVCLRLVVVACLFGSELYCSNFLAGCLV